jgi:hypothetical protein
MIKKTSQLFVDDKYKPVYSYQAYDTLYKDGKYQERPHVVTASNVNERIPVKITEKYYKPEELAKKFVFRKSYFLTHTDGASYKFLYDIARDLVERGEFVRLQAYNPETKKPVALVMVSGARPFPAAFLEGRVDGDKYYLAVHLSDRELKPPDLSDKLQKKKKSKKTPKKSTKKAKEEPK